MIAAHSQLSLLAQSGVRPAVERLSGHAGPARGVCVCVCAHSPCLLCCACALLRLLFPLDARALSLTLTLSTLTLLGSTSLIRHSTPQHSSTAQHNNRSDSTAPPLSQHSTVNTVVTGQLQLLHRSQYSAFPADYSPLHIWSKRAGTRGRA